MRQDIIRLRFHLVGGQTVERVIAVTDGMAVTQDSLSELAQRMTQVDRIWMAAGENRAVAIPAMKNVALLEAEGIGIGEHI